MSAPSATSAPLDDDAIADRLADEMLDRAAARFPAADPEFLIRLASLWLRQACGSMTRCPTQDQLAEVFGTSRAYMSQVELCALAKLYRKHSHTLSEFMKP